MKAKKLVPVLVLLVAVAVVAGSGLFSRFVQESLWEKSVTDVLEVTTQGEHALETYLEKDAEALELFVGELAMQDADDFARLDEKFALFDRDDEGATYVCVNLDERLAYRMG